MESGDASLDPAEATEYASVREWSRDANKSLFAPELAEEALQYLQQVTVELLADLINSFHSPGPHHSDNSPHLRSPLYNLVQVKELNTCLLGLPG
jgi:hypothetical protein